MAGSLPNDNPYPLHVCFRNHIHERCRVFLISAHQRSEYFAIFKRNLNASCMMRMLLAWRECVALTVRSILSMCGTVYGRTTVDLPELRGRPHHGRFITLVLIVSATVRRQQTCRLQTCRSLDFLSPHDHSVLFKKKMISHCTCSQYHTVRQARLAGWHTV